MTTLHAFAAYLVDRQLVQKKQLPISAAGPPTTFPFVINPGWGRTAKARSQALLLFMAKRKDEWFRPIGVGPS